MPRLHAVLALGTAALCLAAAAPASGQAEPASAALTGQVVDPGLYVRDGTAGSIEQAYEALDGGQSLAFLAENGALYLLLAERPGEDPNELVYDYVNQRVTLTGRVYERGGIKGMVVESVESLEPVADAAGPEDRPGEEPAED